MLREYLTVLIVGSCVVIFGLGILVWHITGPHSVLQYGSLRVGEPSPFQSVKSIIVPIIQAQEGLRFYIYALQRDFDMGCEYEECGMSGIIVDCMNGWLSGDGASTEMSEMADAAGMDYERLSEGKASLIVVVDKSLKIVGLYPNYTTHYITRILKKHPELYDPKTLQWCLDYHMPR